MSGRDLYKASERGDLTAVEIQLDSGADVNWHDGVYYILYYTVMCTVVIDIIIIYYSLERHLLWLPVRGVVSVYVTFSSTEEPISI